MTAVAVSLRMPDVVLVLKGDKPLEFRCHMDRQIVLYASRDAHIEEVLPYERGWKEMLVPETTLLAFHRQGGCMPFSAPFTFIKQIRRTGPEGEAP